MNKFFIDPHWSLTEVKNHLTETVFSTENINEVRTIVSKNFLRYKRQYLRWLEDCGDELYCIFDSITFKDKYPIKLIGTPYYARDGYTVDIMFHAFVRYKDHWMLAALIDSQVVLYSHHSFERYDQKFNERFISQVDDLTIAEALIYNNMAWVHKYYWNGRQYMYNLVRDGIFICANVQGELLRKTFVPKDKFHFEQRKFYNAKLPEINQKLKTMGIPPICKAA